jgi:hypothetical protein
MKKRIGIKTRLATKRKLLRNKTLFSDVLRSTFHVVWATAVSNIRMNRFNDKEYLE